MKVEKFEVNILRHVILSLVFVGGIKLKQVRKFV